jgi:basic amino acid/polyamine antiporter, APA family
MEQKYSRKVAVNMVIANMIGTGIFTSLGYQVIEGSIPDAFTIVLIWTLGGLLSLCGATVYAEIATRINRSGGEYRFLTEIYHPLLGFVSGWISLIVGFAAAIASLSLAASEYFAPVLGEGADYFSVLGIKLKTSNWIATLLVLLVAAVQLGGVKRTSIFQNAMTYFKLALIVLFLTLPFIFQGNYEASGVSFLPTAESKDLIFSSAFAGALVWVMFAYSGWNASSYIVGSLKDPKKNLPYSLVVGTLLVTVIYIALNMTFLYVAEFDELAFQVDLGNVVAKKVLGAPIALMFGLVFSIALISGVNAMFIAGPRVVQEIGLDHSLFKRLGEQRTNGAPRNAVLVLSAVSIVLIHLLSFSDLIEYIGVTLSIFSLLTVVGLFILRKKDKGKSEAHVVRAWGYPITPILFSVFVIWMIVYFSMAKPVVLLWFFITIVPAILLYFFSGFGKSK